MPEEYTTLRDDLASIIAQYVSGVKGALPEQDDFDQADVLVAFLKDMD